MNLVKLAPDKMRAGSAVEKDRVARILFLNLVVDNEKRLSVIWKEPFASLVRAIEMSSGALEASDFEQLRAVSEWLIETPDEELIELIRQKPQTGLVYTYRL